MKSSFSSGVLGLYNINQESLGTTVKTEAAKKMKPKQGKLTWVREREQSPDDGVFSPGSSHA